ncbi:OLC1v1015679C2 [Oldenlandia corymbosa var. corymbosa]|uniref:OLC1v1015679C2 n=1 Tax=Oldenlandia corymbosa var. corymbosa TaxID=529605 RepID=A0AAV1E498_OLDCO|nr:OLC1v1015679C2 [Oldenlandia corymbosa var. corymbosa]
MAPRKSKRCRTGAPQETKEANRSNFRPMFETLFSALRSPSEGVRPAILKRLYLVLNNLCSNPECVVDELQLDREVDSDRSKVTANDIQGLSDVLFEELSQRFKKFFDALYTGSSDEDLGNDVYGAAETLNLLLRCCLVVMILLEQQKVVLEKGLIVLGMLRSLCSVDLKVVKWRKREKAIRFAKSVSVAYEYSNNDSTTLTEDFVASLHFLEPSDSRIPLVTSMLEVFLDELLVSGQLRPLFIIINSFAATTCTGLANPGHGDFGLLMEIICNHFYLSFSADGAIEDFFGRLFWMNTNEFKYSFRALELSPTAATTLLLLNTFLLSAPKFLQAHVIAVISEATSIVMDFRSWKPDGRFLNCFLSVFESSVGFYKANLGRWKIDSNHRSSEGSYKSKNHGETVRPSFDSFLSQDTRKKINYVMTKLKVPSYSCLHKVSNKSDLMSSSIRYAKECEHVFDESCQHEILSVLSCIVQRASEGLGDAESHSIGLGDLEDLCIIASVLKLMAKSLLLVINCLRHGGDLHGLKSLRDFSLCVEYDSILSAINCFTEFKIHLPIQDFLSNTMDSSSTSHCKSKIMFLHFSGLLSYAFTTGLDFLVKGCLLNIVALLNLFIFEEGSLYALHSLLSSSSGSIPSNFPSVTIQEVCPYTFCSLGGINC